MADRLLTARSLADLLDVSPETVLRWARRREIPSIRLPGGAVRFREDDVERWLEERAAPRRGSASHPDGCRPAATLPVASHPNDDEED